MGKIRKLNNNVNIIGRNLKKIRKLRKISQSNLCTKLQLLGVMMYESDIYEIENNKRLVKDFEIKAISIALEIDIRQLYDGTDILF